MIFIRKLRTMTSERDLAEIRAQYQERLSEMRAYKDEMEQEPEKEEEAETPYVTSQEEFIGGNRFEEELPLLHVYVPRWKDTATHIKDDPAEDDDPDDPGPPKEGIAETPYVISQEEFIGGNRFYDKLTLNYYDDGILEDDLTEEIIDHPFEVLGRDFVGKFGEYEDDVVFVRNEKLSTDYEVIRQYRNFIESRRVDDYLKEKYDRTRRRYIPGDEEEDGQNI